MKNLVNGLFLWLSLADGPSAWACAACRPQVNASIHRQGYSLHLVVLLPVLVLLLTGAGLFYAEVLRKTWLSHAKRWLNKRGVLR